MTNPPKTANTRSARYRPKLLNKHSNVPHCELNLPRRRPVLIKVLVKSFRGPPDTSTSRLQFSQPTRPHTPIAQLGS